MTHSAAAAPERATSSSVTRFPPAPCDRHLDGGIAEMKTICEHACAGCCQDDRTGTSCEPTPSTLIVPDEYAWVEESPGHDWCIEDFGWQGSVNGLLAEVGFRRDLFGDGGD